MSKYVVRHSWDYKVTVKVPCPECKEFVEERDCKLHSEHVFGEGYIKLHACRPCFDKHIKEVQARVKPSFTGWEGV